MKPELKEIFSGFRRISLVGILSWHDIRSRYRRSAIGPFWLTISMGVMIATIGLVFGKIFNTPMQDFLPFLTIGIISWTFITTTITEGCAGFIEAEGVIKQLPIPLFVHILRVLWRNLIILGHNLVILPLLMVVLGKGVSLVALLAIPGLLLVVFCLGWIALFFAIICARYRDLPLIVTSVLQVAFYLTPIIWMPKLLPDRMGLAFLTLNPFYHFLELIRAPFLGNIPSLTSWLVVGGIAILGWCFTLTVFARFRRRVAYWL